MKTDGTKDRLVPCVPGTAVTATDDSRELVLSLQRQIAAHAFQTAKTPRISIQLSLTEIFGWLGQIVERYFGHRHRSVVVKTMLPWGDDSRTCQLFNGNPAVVGGARTIREGDYLTMLCPTGNIEGDWRLTYVGTVKLDDASEREFESQDKYFVPVLCTKDAKTFDCIKQTN